jgi:mRNA interferase HigB
MRIFSKKTIREYWELHPDSEQSLKSWYAEAFKAKWEKPHDIKSMYANASILMNNRVVFNISGNTYRLVVKINYQRQWIFIRFIGTHEEYDKIDANNI